MTLRSTRSAWLGLACVLALPGTAVAQGDGPPWQQLSPPQRAALAPLERDWHAIGPDRKQKWIDIANRFPHLSADERERIQLRMREWAGMSPAERGEARLRYQQSRNLPAEERHQRWEDYRALPPERRRELAQRAGPSSPWPGSPAQRGARAVPQTKSGLVGEPAPLPPVRPVAPTILQARPGASTTLISRPPAPPLHQQSGLPKIAATPGFVDRTTLLPQRGAQAAAIAPPAAASASRSRGR